MPSPPPRPLQPPFLPRALAALVVVGLAARLAQWWADPSLWMDEISVVDAVLNLSLGPLLTDPLPHRQVAPAGFLALERMASALFGSSGRALRLVPLLASAASLILFARLAHRLLRPAGAVLGVAAFAFNPFLVSLAGTVKQYAGDALAGVLILMAFQALRRPGGSRGRRMAWAVGAGLLGWLSIPSVLLAAGVLAVLGWTWIQGDDTGSREAADLTPLATWAGLAGVAALWAHTRISPEVGAYMQAFWSDWNAFAPPFLDYPTWAVEHFSRTFVPGFLVSPYMGWVRQPSTGLALVTGTLLLAGATAVALGRVRAGGPGWAAALVLPFLLSLALSRLGLYPLAPRTSAHLVPPFLLLLGAAADLPRGRWAGSAGPLLAGAGALAAVLGLLLRPPPYGVQPTREMLRELAAHHRPGEPIFAQARNAATLAYYGPRLGLEDDTDVPESEDVRETLRALEAYRGLPSFWVFLTHPPDERAVIRCFLDEMGVETYEATAQGSLPALDISIHRYDARSSAAGDLPDADLFPVGAAAFEGPDPRCDPPGRTGPAP